MKQTTLIAFFLIFLLFFPANKLVLLAQDECPSNEIEAATILQSLQNAQDSQILDYSDYTIKDMLDLRSTSIEAEVHFINSCFRDGANFTDAVFQKMVVFAETRFYGSINFNNVSFHGATYFDNAEFNESVDFSSAQFEGEIAFRGTIFYGDATFIATKFLYLEAPPHFENALFVKQANFMQTTFSNEISFNAVVFSDNLSFRGSRFEGELSFPNSSSGVVDLRGISFSEMRQMALFNFVYEQLIYDNFNPEWINENGDPSFINNFYEQLELEYRKRGNQALGNETLYQRMEWVCRNQSDWGMGVNCFFSGLLGHFVRLWWILFEIVIVIVGAAGLYIPLKVNRRATSSAAFVLRPFATTLRVRNRSQRRMEEKEGFLQKLSLSFDIFVAFRLSSLNVEIKCPDKFARGFARLLIFVEWLIGIVLMIALATTLLNTLPIVSMVFNQLR